MTECGEVCVIAHSDFFGEVTHAGENDDSEDEEKDEKKEFPGTHVQSVQQDF